MLLHAAQGHVNTAHVESLLWACTFVCVWSGTVQRKSTNKKTNNSRSNYTSGCERQLRNNVADGSRLNSTKDILSEIAESAWYKEPFAISSQT